jgi:WD40 repeat protein
VRLWDPATGTPVGEPLTGHTSGVVAVCPVPGPGGRTLLATGGGDKTVRLWDPATGTPIRVLQVGIEVIALCALPDASLAIATSEGVAVLVARLLRT